MISKFHFRIKKNGNPYWDCYCTKPELIENYDKAIADTTQIWECHHRLETHFSDGTERPRNAQLSRKELIALGMYFDRPSEEFIFLTEGIHHGLRSGTKHSEETRRNISEALKGKPSLKKGIKTGPRSEETKKKLSESHKGKPTWNKGKHRTWYTNGNKGMHWYNNGIVQMQAFECPNGFVKGMLPK